jgi:hypothetical protein
VASAATAPKTASRTPAARRAAARRSATMRAAPARRTTARRPARTSRLAVPIPRRLVPLAVGRTAGAVGGLADSGLVMRLTRGRLWIGALAVLLVGIVALNVVALSFTASSSDTARKAEDLSGQGSALRAQLAKELSSERVQRVAAGLGLIVPEPGSIRYLRPSDGDAAEAARRLRSGELVAVAPAPVATDPGVAEAAVPVTPAEPEAAAPEAPTEPVIEAPAPTTEAPAVEPSTSSPGGGALGGDSGVGGGGVAPP